MSLYAVPTPEPRCDLCGTEPREHNRLHVIHSRAGESHVCYACTEEMRRLVRQHAAEIGLDWIEPAS